MQSPSISIIIPTLNRAHLIEQTLASLRNQTFQAWEAVIVDDGSQAEDVARVQQLVQQDARMQFIQRQEAPSGASACRNLGTRLTRGQYVIYLDSDDCLATTALEQRFQCMEASPDLDFGVFPCIVFREHPYDMKRLMNWESAISDLDRLLGFDSPWQTMCSIWRRSAILKIGMWDETLLSRQDTELHIRAVALGLKYRKFNQPDCFLRVFQHNSVSAQARSIDHSPSHRYLLPKLQQILTQTGLFTPHRKHLLNAAYFWTMHEMASQGYRAQALDFWRVGYEEGVCTRWIYQQGIWYAQISQRWVPHLAQKALQRLMRAWFRFSWQPYFINYPAVMLLKTPIDPADMPAIQIQSASTAMTAQEELLHNAIPTA